jgi:hypothetical protein
MTLSLTLSLSLSLSLFIQESVSPTLFEQLLLRQNLVFFFLQRVFVANKAKEMVISSILLT